MGGFLCGQRRCEAAEQGWQPRLSPGGGAFLPDFIDLRVFFVFAGPLPLEAVPRARLKWASTMLLVSPWKYVRMMD